MHRGQILPLLPLLLCAPALAEEMPGGPDKAVREGAEVVVTGEFHMPSGCISFGGAKSGIGELAEMTNAVAMTVLGRDTGADLCIATYEVQDWSLRIPAPETANFVVVATVWTRAGEIEPPILTILPIE